MPHRRAEDDELHQHQRAEDRERWNVRLWKPSEVIAVVSAFITIGIFAASVYANSENLRDLKAENQRTIREVKDEVKAIREELLKRIDSNDARIDSAAGVTSAIRERVAALEARTPTTR